MMHKCCNHFQSIKRLCGFKVEWAFHSITSGFEPNTFVVWFGLFWNNNKIKKKKKNLAMRKLMKCKGVIGGSGATFTIACQQWLHVQVELSHWSLRQPMHRPINSMVKKFNSTLGEWKINILWTLGVNSCESQKS
jgi:hypothetical protein